VPEKAQSIRGIVKDCTGLAVVGATIIAGGGDGSGERLTTTSNADGRFTFDRFPSGRNPTYATAVVAAKEGFAPVLGHASSHNDREVILTMPEAAKYAGTLKDRAGRAIVGAEVQFGIVNRHGNAATWGYSPANHLRGSQAEKFFLARTDAAGAFRFTTVPAGAELIFRVTAEGFAETDTAATGPNREYVVGPNAMQAHLTLDPEAIIRGRVTSRVPGLAVKDVSVRLTSTGGAGSLYRFTKPDSEGRFEFKGLPGGPCGVYLAIPASMRAAAAGVTLAPKFGETVDANLEVVEGVEVTGVVRVRDGGPPVVGAEITAIGSFNPNGNDFTRPVTDSAGRFHLRLPPGEAKVMVWASPAGYSHPTNNWEQRKVTVPAGVKTFAIPEPFEMIYVVKNLTGHVTDIAGKPIPHVKISALKHSSVCGDFATDPVAASYDGQFALPYSPNGPLELGRSIPLRVELPDGRRFEANALVVKVGVAEVRLPTFPEIAGLQDVKPNEFAGIVVDEKGKPLAGVKVHMWDWVDKPENYTFTGPDGIFRFKDCGDEREVEVRFRKDGYSPVMIVRQQVGVKGLVIAMDRTTYFEGIVRGPNGNPAVGVVVRADQGPKILNDGGTTTPGCICTSLITETTTDAQGHYRLYVQPDEYVINVKAAGVGVVRLPKTGIAHGQARSFDIQLQPGLTFRARVLDSLTGQPVAGLRLFNREQKDVDGRSDNSGEIIIKDMLPGEFTFNVESDRYARWWSEQVTHEWERKQAVDSPRFNFQRNFDGLTFDLKPGMATVTIVAEPAVRVTGKVLDPNGKPVSGATVGPANGMWFWAETKTDGTFALTLPASGATEYNLLAHDGKYDEWRIWANGVLPQIKTTPGQTIDGVTLKLTRPSVVRGKVVDENGLPVAGREVRAHAADRLEETHYLNPSTKTKADGTFELKFVRPAEQLIQVAPFWLYGKDAPPNTSRKLTLKEGQVVESVILVSPAE
jgi:protocatechuate 3,4-dioxygenase beta subunit